jgi:hypothetical protein
MRLLPIMLNACLTSLLLTSCSEDPESKTRHEAQTRRIVDMEARIAVLRERMRTPIPDNAARLESARRAAELMQGTVKGKELELERVRSAVKVAEQQLEDFERKHKISGGRPR